jgi:hypothetical protein
MPEYIVYRHGWNDANQSPQRGLPEKMPVVRLEADTPEEACRLAAPLVTVMPGQHLSADPAAEVDAEVNNMDLKPEALEREEAP